jgi:hypothetical protein
MRSFILSLLALAAASSAMVGQAQKAEGPATAGETKRVRWASVPPVKQNTYHALRMKDNPVIDADWNKAAWKHATPAALEYYMGEAPAHQPKAQVKVAYDDQYLYVIWKVEDQFVLGKRTKHDQDVWRDSCVEIFFTPGTDPEKLGYINLETNCTGVKLFGYHVAGKDERLTDKEFDSITTGSSLKGPIDSEIVQPTTWTLEYRIPFSLLERFTKFDRPKRGVIWRANFYKIAERTSHPHWLTWSPVHNAEPSFHLPKYFGILKFE